MTPQTSGYGLNFHKDRDLILSAAQVLDDTADTESTNTITMGSTDFPKGNPIKGKVFVTTLVGTLTIKVCGSSDGADPEATDLLDTITVGSGLTGVVDFTIPESQQVDRVNLFYSAGTSGVVTAYLTAEV